MILWVRRVGKQNNTKPSWAGFTPYTEEPMPNNNKRGIFVHTTDFPFRV